MATLIHKAIHTGSPPYLADLLQQHRPTKSMRSLATLLCQCHATTSISVHQTNLTAFLLLTTRYLWLHCFYT